MTTARLCGLRTGGRTQPSLERFSTRQTSPPVETGSICRRNPFIAGSPAPEGSHGSRTSQASSTELCTTGSVSPHLTVGPATTTSTALRLTQQYQTTAMKLSPQGATRLFLCSYQVSNCPVTLVRGGRG